MVFVGSPAKIKVKEANLKWASIKRGARSTNSGFDLGTLR